MLQHVEDHFFPVRFHSHVFLIVPAPSVLMCLILDLILELGPSSCPLVVEKCIIVGVNHPDVVLAQLGYCSGERERAFVTNFIVDEWLRVDQLKQLFIEESVSLKPYCANLAIALRVL